MFSFVVAFGSKMFSFVVAFQSLAFNFTLGIIHSSTRDYRKLKATGFDTF